MSGAASRRPGGELLIATTNPAKAERLCWVFGGLGLRLEPLRPEHGSGPEETGASFVENAEIKARFWSRDVVGLVAASDGGLAIPALGSAWNALRTARAAGPAADDLARARHLLAVCADLRGEERRVYWSEALALARSGEVLASWSEPGAEAVLLSEIPSAGLRPGFWAASLCYLPEHDITLAELDENQLAELDIGWSRLRERVRRYFGLGEADG